MRIKIMPEYGCSPVWLVGEGPSENVPVDALNVPDSIRESLAAWDATFQVTLDPEYPPDSGFDCEERRESYFAEGRRLVAELARHVGDVRYVPPRV